MTDDRANSQCGFVFAVTGEGYITLARRAARSLRLVHPEAQIDLFADTALDDPVFDQAHMLGESWFRPKMEALMRSRFERTVYLDADLMVVASLTPVFEVLDRFDVAICQDRMMNSDFVQEFHKRPIPHAFATQNAGVIGLRKTDAVLAFLERWQAEVRDSGVGKDQPAFRELLYDSDLRICPLPQAYNLMAFHELRTWWGMVGAPRVLHAPFLRKRREGPGDPEKPFTYSELVGPVNALRMKALLRADRGLSPDVPEKMRNMYWSLEPAPLRWARNRAKPIYRRLRYRFK